MLSTLLKKIENQLSQENAFVIYRKPHEDRVVAVFQKNDALNYTKEFTETGFVFAPFNTNEPIVLLIPNEIEEVIYVSEIAHSVENEGRIKIDAEQKEFHINLIKKGIQEIKANSFKKVVLSRKIQMDCDLNPVELFKTLLDTYSSAFCYLWYHPKVGLWLGATPEILLKTENKQLTTMSLAGTQTYKGENNPAWGSKELEEQQLVTEFIVNALKKNVTVLKVSEATSSRAGNLWHLRTSVVGLLQTNHIKDIIKVLHPTPAVCGLPKDTTKSFILENEGYNREYYTGFLGELNYKTQKDRTTTKRNQENKAYKVIKNKTALFVNLRCMQLKQNKAHIYVGGGITAASISEKEWEETEAKSDTMRKILFNSVK